MAKRRGTVVKFPDGQTVVFQEKLSRAVAIKRAMKARKAVMNPVSDPVQHAMERFREFNNKEPRELATLDLNLNKTPLINIGKVPEIHYTSRKEGERRPVHYVHYLKKQGTMYAHPDGGLFLTIAPSTTVSDWLRENPGDITTPLPVFRSTEQAHEFGKSATSLQRKQLTDRREVNLALTAQARSRKEMIEAIHHATMAQFDREALEAGIQNKSLIAENIDKATLRYEALSESAKEKVKSKRSWIMKVAWQIQRGRIKGYGHK